MSREAREARMRRAQEHVPRKDRDSPRKAALAAQGKGPVAIWDDQVARASTEPDSVHDKP